MLNGCHTLKKILFCIQKGVWGKWDYSQAGTRRERWALFTPSPPPFLLFSPYVHCIRVLVCAQCSTVTPIFLILALSFTVFFIIQEQAYTLLTHQISNTIESAMVFNHSPAQVMNCLQWTSVTFFCFLLVVFLLHTGIQNVCAFLERFKNFLQCNMKWCGVEWCCSHIIAVVAISLQGTIHKSPEATLVGLQPCIDFSTAANLLCI